MDQLHLMNVFVAVGEEEGFAAAARRLGLSPAAVTRAIAALEERLGVKLLLRTTRNVRLTEAGRRYLDDTRNILASVAEANEAAAGVNAAPRGNLSVTAPVLFGKIHVMPCIVRYLDEYPEVDVSAYFLDRVVNLVEEGIDVPAKERDTADPLWDNLAAGRDVGMLFIELGSRRRYRVNGEVVRFDEGGFEVAVREAYPNCPKYIQRRDLRLPGDARPPAVSCCAAAGGTVLAGGVEHIVARADTMFVASGHAAAGVDVSHRGGPPGFARIVNGTTLRIPDYRGNGLFNTLGNIAVDGRAGICIPDFDGGRLLQLTGTARVLYQDDPYGETGGTRRWWEFGLDRWILRDTPREPAWEYLDASPFNPERILP